MTDNNKTESTIERRTFPFKNECLKLDTFAAIKDSLERIDEKLDCISEEMRTMIKLETQVIQQNKDIERLTITVESLRNQNQELSQRMLELRNHFENQKKSLGNIERVAWAVATCAAIVIGKYFGIS